MAFCNSCGAPLDASVKFCNKCGAATGLPAVATQPAGAGPAGPAAGAQGSGSALKIILIVVAVIVCIGVLGMATVGFIGWRIARSSHLRQEGDHVRVETPFGNLESTKDPDVVARDLGIEAYPGAQALKDGAVSATFGQVHTLAVNFESSDSPEQVTNFYKSKFPNAIVSVSEEGHSTIVSNDHKDMVTINIEPEDGKTKIHISKVTKKSSSDAPAAD
jgi:hypothetical protein